MSSEIFYITIFIVSVLITSLSQVMLKKAAQKEYSSLSEEYLNPPVIFAYSLFFLATLVTVYAFRSVPLSFGPVLEALSYVFVGMLSILILKEKVSKKGVLGMALIIVGVVVFSL